MSIEQASFWLGMVGLAQFLPLFLLTLLAGYVADRVDRRWIVRISLASEMICAAALAALVLARLDVAGAVVCGRDPARHRPRLRHAGLGLDRAEPRPARHPAERDRAQFDRLAGGHGRRAADRRRGLRGVAEPALRGLGRALCGLARLHAAAPADPARQCRPIAPGPRGDRGPGLCPRQQDRARRDQPRSVRRAARRRDRDAARLRPRHPPCRPGRARRAARRAGGRRRLDGAAARPLPAEAAGGHEDVRLRRHFRAGDDGVRPEPLDVALARRSVRARRVGHDQRLRPLVADPAAHAGCDARPGLRRLRPLHLRLERARRVPRRAGRLGLRAGHGGGRRRRAGGCGYRLLRLGLPEPAQGRPLRHARRGTARDRQQGHARKSNPAIAASRPRKEHHESRQHPRDDRQHAARPNQPPVRRRRGLDQAGAGQSRRLDQGPDRARR